MVVVLVSLVAESSSVVVELEFVVAGFLEDDVVPVLPVEFVVPA